MERQLREREERRRNREQSRGGSAIDTMKSEYSRNDFKQVSQTTLNGHAKKEARSPFAQKQQGYGGGRSDGRPQRRPSVPEMKKKKKKGLFSCFRGSDSE
jgi:hypothetical protein